MRDLQNSNIAGQTEEERAMACLYSLNAQNVHLEAKRRAKVKTPITKMERALRRATHEKY